MYDGESNAALHKRLNHLKTQIEDILVNVTITDIVWLRRLQQEGVTLSTVDEVDRVDACIDFCSKCWTKELLEKELFCREMDESEIDDKIRDS